DELIPNELDPFQQRIGRRRRRLARRRDRAIEIVEHLEQLRQDRSLGAVDVARHVTAHPRADLLELICRAAPIGERGLQLSCLIGDPAFEVLDIRGFANALLGRRLFSVRRARPPPSIHDANRNLIVRLCHVHILSPRCAAARWLRRVRAWNEIATRASWASARVTKETAGVARTGHSTAARAEPSAAADLKAAAAARTSARPRFRAFAPRMRQAGGARPIRSMRWTVMS